MSVHKTIDRTSLKKKLTIYGGANNVDNIRDLIKEWLIYYIDNDVAGY